MALEDLKENSQQSKSVIYIRVGKTGSLGPWRRLIVYCSKLYFCQNDPPIFAKGKLVRIHYDSALRPQRSSAAK